MARPSTLVVTIPGMIGEDDLAPLRQCSDVEYREMAKVDQDDLASLCEGFNYLMLNYDVIGKLREDFYNNPNVKNLTAIAADITGMDWASPQGAIANGVRLLNIPHYSTESVAESILCEVLLHTRQRHAAYVDEIKDREIQGRKGINLLDRTGGVVGLGSIGTRVAELLAGVGMNVAAWNRTPRKGYNLVSLEELFEAASVICICLKTVNSGPDCNLKIIGDDLLRRCSQAVIVNLANANLVDYDALAKYIKAGNVSGYSADRSPALLDSPVAGLDAVHMPPANAWSSDESMATLRKIWVENVLFAIDDRFQNVYVD